MAKKKRRQIRPDALERVKKYLGEVPGTGLMSSRALVGLS